MHMDVRRTETDPQAAFKLSSENLVNNVPELRIEESYPLPGNTSGPALIITIPASKNTTALTGKKGSAGAVFDIEFSGPNTEPITLIRGELTVLQDVTHV